MTVIDNIIELHKKGISRRDISRLLNCSSSTVSAGICKYKVANGEMSIDDIDGVGKRIIELRKKGYSLNAISKRIGRRKSLISKYCSVLPNADEIVANNIRREQQKRRNAMNLRLEKLKSKMDIIDIIKQNNSNKPAFSSTERNYLMRLSRKLFLSSVVKYKCQGCGYNKYIGNLSFHHRQQTAKSFDISNYGRRSSLKELVAEVSKCVLLCHNCHGEAHIGMLDISKLRTLSYDNIKLPESTLKWCKENCPKLLQKQIKSTKLAEEVIK